MVLHGSLIGVSDEFRQLDLVVFRPCWRSFRVDIVVLQEEFQRFDNVVDVVKLIVFHSVSQKHVCRALSKSLVQHFQRVLERYHRVLYAMEYYRRTFYVFSSLKVVKSLLDKQVNNSSVFHSSDIFDGFDRTNQKQTCWIECTREMTSRTRSYGSTTYENLIVPQIELVFEEIVYGLSIL